MSRHMKAFPIAFVLGLALLPQPASACMVAINPEQPPRTRAERDYVARAQRQYARLILDRYAAASVAIEVELLDDPHFPAPSRARILAVHKGGFAPGDEIRLYLQPPNNCGNLLGTHPRQGDRGLLQLNDTAREIAFPGFVPAMDVEILRDNHVLPRPRRRRR